MAQGKVSVYNLNLSQGEFPEVERTLLFIGHVPTQAGVAIPFGQVCTCNTQTDFDKELGASGSVLKNNLKAAMQNAGQNWQAYYVPVEAEADYLATIDMAVRSCSPEGIVILEVVESAADIEAFSAKIMELRATHGLFMFAMLAARGILPNETWAAYRAALEDMVDGVAANMCMVVPKLHGNDIGVLAGRLCNREVSIADTPMRVATGPVLGLGATPKDSTGDDLPDSLLADMAGSLRLSCIQRYVGYPGTYWADGMMLDVPAGDYQVIEYVRPILKAMRAVRILAIARIGNRLLNSTPASIAAHKQYFARPLREMSKSVTFAGYTFPGDIEPPTKDAVEIVWMSKTKVEIYLKLRPYNRPKDIKANLVLDLSNEV